MSDAMKCSYCNGPLSSSVKCAHCSNYEKVVLRTAPAETDAELLAKLRRVTAVVCWQCRSVTYREDYYALDGCQDCGAKSSADVMALPLVWRPADHGAPEAAGAARTEGDG